MAQEILTILEADAGSPKPAAERVFAGHGENGPGGKYYFLPSDIRRAPGSTADTGDNVLEGGRPRRSPAAPPAAGSPSSSPA